jgi:catechol-2,3-dioxygenase
MRIEQLQVFTGNLPEQKDFYENILQLPLKNVSETSFQVQVGYSVLEFQQKESATPYHIALHIPALQEKKALEWLKKRVYILKDGEAEIVDFPAWKAKSIYFYDADKNIVEFISRRHCFPPESDKFSEKNIVGISEIGLATSDVKSAFDFLNQHFSLEKFTGDYEHFCATGDDEGLFIVINKKQKDWFPSNDKAFASDFKISFSTASGKAEMAYKNERLQLL